MPSIPHVSIHIRQDYPLNRQLDASAGNLVLRKIEDLGVKVVTRSTIKEMTTAKDGDGEVFTGFETATDPIESDLVIYAVGIKPRDDLARTSGIELDAGGGIKVGDDLMSSAEGVYAIGECASWQGNVSLAHASADASSTALSLPVSRWPISSLSTLLKPTALVPPNTLLAK
jgi:nitrite reductase (NAD(P)H)